MQLVQIRAYWRQARLLLGVLACYLLGGCAPVILVDAEFPQPLVEPLPVRIGLLLNEELLAYEYIERIPQQASYTIRIGNANALMMNRLFQPMFAAVESVDDLPLAQPGSSRIDGVLIPELERYEFDVPIGMQDEFVEVWMQYLLRLYEPNGELITEWPISGYGKSELTKTSDRVNAISRATVLAMREVGAVIATKFAEQPEVEYWLQER